MERRLAAILAADVVGYTSLMEANEAGTLSSLKSHRQELIDPKAAQYHGRTIKLMGDGALMEFASVVDAVAFAIEVQLGMRERNSEIPEDQQIVYRIGINIGDVIVEGDDIYGDGVNVAARLESAAEPGGILVHRNVHNQVRDKLEIEFEDLGDIEVRNIVRPVSVFSVLLDDKAAALVTPVMMPPRHRQNLTVAAVASGLIIIAGVAWYQPWAPTIDPSSVEAVQLPILDQPSVAVLPFHNTSGDLEEEYFADGLTDDLITDLSKISGLFVIARQSMFTYKGQKIKIREVAKELGVRYVLEGSVRRAGGKVRINVQLIDTKADRNLWAERYEGDREDIFALQDKVMGKIVSALALRLSDQEQKQLARIPTKNLEAYDNFLRAELGTYSVDSALILKSISRYQKAIELDAEFAEAYAGLARLYADLLRNDWDSLILGPVARERAYSAATRAIELQPELSRPFSVLSVVQVVDGEHDQAITSARRAVALAPNDAEAYINLALVLAYSGLLGEAVEQVDLAFRFNPKPPPGFLLIGGLVMFMERQYERAAQLLERAQKVMPNSVMSMEVLAATYAQLDRMEAAKTQLELGMNIAPFWSIANEKVGRAHYKRPQDLTHRLDALRKAGLPDWPFGFEGESKDRLTSAQINLLISRQTWSGREGKAEAFFVNFGEDGSFALRTESALRTGTARVKDDNLCLKTPSQILGRELCGPIYRNPTGTPTKKNEYTYVSALSLFEFSVER